MKQYYHLLHQCAFISSWSLCFLMMYEAYQDHSNAAIWAAYCVIVYAVLAYYFQEKINAG